MNIHPDHAFYIVAGIATLAVLCVIVYCNKLGVL